MKAIPISSKGQLTLPVTMRRKLGLTDAGGWLHVGFNELTKEAVIKKPARIEELTKFNQTILQRQHADLTDYKSGDGFRAHVAKKYGIKQ